MHRAFVVGCLCLLSLVGCAGTEAAEEQGDSQNNLITVPGKGRLSVLVAIKQGAKGTPAHVTLKCGGPAGRDDLAGDADEEGILFPIVRPEDCTIVATVRATEPGKTDTAIELHHAAKAQTDTVLSGSLDGYTTTATFGDPIP